VTATNNELKIDPKANPFLNPVDLTTVVADEADVPDVAEVEAMAAAGEADALLCLAVAVVFTHDALEAVNDEERTMSLH
jgi:hypothetical protein